MGVPLFHPHVSLLYLHKWRKETHMEVFDLCISLPVLRIGSWKYLFLSVQYPNGRGIYATEGDNGQRFRRPLKSVYAKEGLSLLSMRPKKAIRIHAWFNSTLRDTTSTLQPKAPAQGSSPRLQPKAPAQGRQVSHNTKRLRPFIRLYPLVPVPAFCSPFRVVLRLWLSKIAPLGRAFWPSWRPS